LQVNDPSLRQTLANVVRNLAPHLATNSPRLNARLRRMERSAISALGIDPEDKRAARVEFKIWGYGHNEYFAGSPLHVLLFCGTILWLLGRRRWWRTEVFAFTLGTLGALLSFCVLVPWWPTNARLHTAPLALAAAATAVLLERAGRLAAIAALVPTLLLALADAAHSQFRPLVSGRGATSVFLADRWSQLFVDTEWLRPSYTTVATELKTSGCREIGIDASTGERFDYPLLWALGAARGETRVWDVQVENPSARLAGPFEAKPPCAVACIECLTHSQKRARHARDLPCQKEIGRHVLFERPERGADLARSECRPGFFR
jgi:hypothetical protein